VELELSQCEEPDTAMTTAFVLDAETALQTQEDGPDYRQQHPLQIAMCLRALMGRHERLNIAFENRQMFVEVLEVDSRHATFTFSFGNVDADNAAMVEADQLSFSSLPGAIETRFVTYGAKRVYFNNRPAFEASFPSTLIHVQRRQHFRVHTPIMDPFVAVGTNAHGAHFRFELQDMSLGGVAVRTHDSRYANIATGTILHDVELQLGHFGSVKLDLEVMAPREAKNAKGDALYVIGCRFVERNGVADRLLQRVIMHLECKH